jgi:ferrous-iron efflux pump FieF
MRLATYASVSAAITLILVKVIAWWITGSVALLSSLVDSLLDAAASVITLLAVRQSLTPADAEHRFGHGKAEALAALLQAGLITGSALFIVFESLPRLVDPEPVESGGLGVAVMLFSIVVTFALTRFQAYVVKHTSSTAIQADALHYLADLLTNSGVIIALLLATQLGWHLADPIIALIIAGYIFWSALQIGRHAFDMLMDRELPDEQRAHILEVARRHPSVLGVHELKTRQSGQRVFIQLHLELEGSMNLYRAHAIADTVEAELETHFPGAEVIIHQDPYVLSEDTPVYR